MLIEKIDIINNTLDLDLRSHKFVNSFFEAMKKLLS